MEAAKLNVDRETVDVAALSDTYQVIGELRGGRLYFARRRDNRTEVVVRVVRSSETGANNALAHLASDVQLLRTLTHPHMPRLLDGRWLGTDAFALVSERIYGTTIQEILDRGERFTNPRIASLLEDVYAVVGWARAHGVVHRGVTPDSIIIERDTNRLFVSLGPTPIPMTGVPGEAADARTIGRLAWTLLSGSPPDVSGETSLVELCPNLAMRVLDETEKFVRLRDDAETPDVGHFIGIIAAGDVLKQAEVELAAAKDEYVEWRENEIQKYEAQRVELERQVTEKVAALEEERRAFEKTASDERASIEADRVQMESAVRERQEKLATVRAELDRQREALERRLVNLEAQRAELVRLRDEAAALGASARIRGGARQGTPVGLTHTESGDEALDDWTDDALDGSGGKPPDSGVSVMQWLGPVATVVVLLLLIAFGVGMSRRSHRGANGVTLGRLRVIPTAPRLDTVSPPRGGFLTQSPGGEVSKAPGRVGAPLVDSTAAARRDSVRPDSVTHRDTTTHRDTVARREGAARRERATRPDTVPRADTVIRDSIPLDATRRVRPDTTKL
ncbi:MAG TPA: hypothetical protein VL524_14070 [Gemmatimonadaceae bacterium]|nr:hypothetical protein [Gemmatimonadaceae bacterium]